MEVAQVVLYHDDKIVPVLTLLRIVQPELLVFKQVTVIGQERYAVIHFQRALPLDWK